MNAPRIQISNKYVTNDMHSYFNYFNYTKLNKILGF